MKKNRGREEEILTDTPINSPQEILTSIIFHPPLVQIPLHLRFSPLDLFLQPQPHFSVSNQAGCYRDIQLQDVTLNTYV